MGFSQGSFFSFIACFPMSDNNCLVYFFQFYDCLLPEGYSNTCYSNITPKQKDLNQNQKKWEHFLDLLHILHPIFQLYNIHIYEK